MSNVKIIMDTAGDLTDDFLKRYDIATVPFSITFDGTAFLKENIDVTIEELYKKMRKGDVFPKTSQPTINEYADVFREYVRAGSHVVCVTLTSKFSGSYQSAQNAAEQINDEFGGTYVYALDSLNATSGEGVMAVYAAKMRDDGLSAREIYDTLSALRGTSTLYITVDTLLYLQKGGRIGKASALAGGLLQIKPVMIFQDGELHPQGKVRGRRNALMECARLIDKDVGAKADDYDFFIAQADVKDEIIEFVKLCETQFGIKLSFPIFNVGATICSHIGPTAVGFGYIKKYNKM